MSEPYNVPENVLAFIDNATVAYAKAKGEEFNQFVWSMCTEISSPIEQLFLVALHLVSEINLVDVGYPKDFNVTDSDQLIVVPQWRVGKYRVDFALKYLLQPEPKVVCIELDGHKFHDRDERQRRYEKTRDRYLTTSGYKVLHFTGSEIFKDPCAAAIEAFNLVTGLRQVAIHPFEEL